MSTKVIKSIHDLESAFDLVVQSYIEFEEECLRLALKSAITRAIDWLEAVDNLHLVNRRVFNLLSASRSFLDRGDSLCRKIAGASFQTDFRQYRSSEYDQSFSYRLIECLRNHSQHAGVTVSELIGESSLELISDDESYGERRRFVFSKRPMLDLIEIARNKRLKPSVIDEAKAHADKKGRIELIPNLRQYLASLGQIMKGVREKTVPMLVSQWAVQSSVIDRYKSAHGDDVLGLRCVALSADGYGTESVALHSGQYDRTTTLVQKNAHLEHAHRFIVSNERALRHREKID